MNKLFQQTKYIITVCITVFVLSTPLLAQESQTDALKKMQTEMEKAFGTIPFYFNVFPEHLRPAAWEMMKAWQSPNAAIPAKYTQLIGLAVAAQIPCNYCVYFHTEMAKMLGASQLEIQEAVAMAADTRFWSTVLNGAVDANYESAKVEIDNMLMYMKKQSKVK